MSFVIKLNRILVKCGLDVSDAIDNTSITIIPSDEWGDYLTSKGLSQSVEAYCCEDGIVMPSNTASNTLVHELIHCVGKVEEKGWEEAITEYLAQEICDVEHMTGYDVSVQAMGEIAQAVKETKDINFAQMLCQAKVNNDLSAVRTLVGEMTSQEEVDTITKMMNKLNIDRFKGASNPWTPYWENKEIEFQSVVSDMLAKIKT